MKSNGNGHNQLFLPGIIALVRLPDGTAIAKVHELDEWLTVRECCEHAHCGEDVIYGLVEDGTLTHRWKNHVGARGTLLIHAGSFQAWLDQQTTIGRLHPQLALKCQKT